jgi:hypothetical protein
MASKRPEENRPRAAARRPFPRPVEEPSGLDDTRMTAGDVLVYFDPEPHGPASFQRGVATGPEIIDPRTDDWWAPVQRPDRSLDLMPAALIVGIITADGELR